ncbi:MAG: nuclear transport factor 2 family protein [Acidimicrobiales bacterium]
MALLKRKRIGLNDAMSVVTRFVNACNRHDADGVGACLHPDFDSIQPMYPSRNFRGADQVRRNWQAIFDAEPGFRLTVLRSAAVDDTVWLELHGAGRDAEVAGIFIMGVVGDRIRWARIYSALVEPVVAGVGEASDPAASLPEVAREEPGTPGSGGVGEEDLIAPVLDIERSGRRRRRRRSQEQAVEAAPAEEASETADEPDVVVADVGAEGEVTEVEPEISGAREPETAAEGEPDPEVVAVEVVAVEVVDVEVVEVVEAEPVAVVEPAVDGGLDTEAVPVVVWDENPAPEAPADEVEVEVEVVAVTVIEELDADPEPAAEVDTDDEAPAASERPAAPPPRRLFGKRPRP